MATYDGNQLSNTPIPPRLKRSTQAVSYVFASLWFTCLLLLAMHSLVAQTLPSRNLSLQQGLPEYYVSGIVQDKAGFVWIATRDGLARYDGRSFKIFRHQPHRVRSMANNIIVALRPVSDTTLLIQFENDGFQRFNPVTEQFSDLLTQQRLLNQRVLMPQATLTPDGRRLWGRQANRLILYRPQANTFSLYPFPLVTLPKDVSFGNSFVLDSRVAIYAPYPGAYSPLTRKQASLTNGQIQTLLSTGRFETTWKPLSSGELPVSCSLGVLDNWLASIRKPGGSARFPFLMPQTLKWGSCTPGWMAMCILPTP